MKNTILKISLIGFFCISNSNWAQNFSGQAFYSSKLNTDEIKNPDSNLLSDDLLKDILNKATTKEYVMTFNKTESFFEENATLDAPNSIDGISFSMTGGGQGKIYTSLKDQKLITETSIFDKEYLVVEKMQTMDWQLSAETKKIGEYICYKATYVKKVTEEEKKEYENFIHHEKTSSSIFLNSEPQDSNVTAWYTSDIPVNFGPDIYYGLPGLILELSNNQITYLCNKIILNPKKEKKVKMPSKGKIISAEKFKNEQAKLFDTIQSTNGSVIIQNN